MDVHSLARTPLFIFSLVVTGIVAAYAFAVTLRMILSKLSALAVTNQLDPKELLTLDLSNIFRGQLSELMDRLAIVEDLFVYIPTLRDDTGWKKIVLISEKLRAGEEELSRCLRRGDISSALTLARVLTSGKGMERPITTPNGVLPIDGLTGWQYQTIELLQRILANAEDALRHTQVSDNPAIASASHSKLQQLREAIIEDEQKIQFKRD